MIELRGINKTYNNGAPLHVLKGIDLDVAEGEMVSIMGASGSGKSTLLNILGILDTYDSGTYKLNGQLIKDLSESQAAEIRNRTKSDPHSLGRWRVNGALPHIDAWYEAFNVKEGDKMFVPKAERLELW